MSSRRAVRNVTDATGRDSAAPRDTWLNRIAPARAVSAGLALALAALVYLLSNQITVRDDLTGVSPQWWPQLIAVFLVVVSVVLISTSIKKTHAHATADVAPVTRPGLNQFVSMVLIIGLYSLAWQFIDFRILSLLAIITLLWSLGVRGWKSLLVFPAAVVALLYVLFSIGFGTAL